MVWITIWIRNTLQLVKELESMEVCEDNHTFFYSLENYYNFLTFSRSGGDICFDVTWSLRRNDQNKYPLHLFYLKTHCI